MGVTKVTAHKCRLAQFLEFGANDRCHLSRDKRFIVAKTRH
jgi:hypothetical protein